MPEGKILVIGANGQLGTELTAALRKWYGHDCVIPADIRQPAGALQDPGFILLDVLNKQLLQSIIQTKKVSQVYLLAAMLSATGEKHPDRAWNLNMQGLINVLELARTQNLKVFWPSSIAVFGPNAPKIYCPQATALEPTTVYGISKAAGELWCKYYFDKYGVDVRSVRYPGLISYHTEPGGGTTDYAVDIFHQAIAHNHYTCFLDRDTSLPMMYMPDAINATIQIMTAPAANIRTRTSYNIAGTSFSPAELASEIRQERPGFTINYEPDFRQAIADSWPHSIDDSHARNDWNWDPQHNTHSIVKDMLANLQQKRRLQPS